MSQSNKKTQPVSMVLEIADETYKSMGSTILEAINNLKKPDHIKAKGVLKVEADGLSAVRRMNIPDIKRLFAKDFVRQVVAKKISLFLK